LKAHLGLRESKAHLVQWVEPVHRALTVQPDLLVPLGPPALPARRESRDRPAHKEWKVHPDRPVELVHQVPTVLLVLAVPTVLLVLAVPTVLLVLLARREFRDRPGLTEQRALAVLQV
jgi:hypothetical protein